MPERKQRLIPRESYLNRLKMFQDREPVKVVTGMRRCGKSSLLALMREHLAASGIAQEQILSLNFESMQYSFMDAAAFYHFVKERVLPGRRMYLFLDEPQRLTGWEDAINSFRADFDCDIYISASNASILSSEYATCLAGRYMEIRVLPLSFKEFLLFHGFESKASSLGNDKRYAVSPEGKILPMEDVFGLYLRSGGIPGLIGTGLDQELALPLLDGVYSTVVVRDILERKRRPGEGQIADHVLLQKIILFLADTIGNNTSLRTICNALATDKLVEERGRRGKPATQTVAAYVNALLQACLFHEIKRFDLKGKDLLGTLGKYYIADIGLRNLLLGFHDKDIGSMLENIVYLELLRRGYDVTAGKIGPRAIDFIATRDTEKIYYQVTLDMDALETREQKLAPLKSVKDNYEKIVLALHTTSTAPIEGIKIVPLLKFLLQ